MLNLNGLQRYFLYRPPCDMRKQFNGLTGLVRMALKMEPASGDVYVFLNRRRDRLKLLVWQGDGFAIYYKRLESGTFEFPAPGELEGSYSLSWNDLILILQGVELQSVRLRKRFQAV